MKLRTLLIAFLLVLLVSCGKEETPTPPVSGEPSTLAVNVKDFTENEPVKDFIVDSESEYARTVLITVSEDVTDIRYYILSTNMEGSDKWSYTTEETLTTVESLSAGESIAVQLEMPELLPNRGIAMLDKNGAEHLYFFSESGKDGSVMLTEYSGEN